MEELRRLGASEQAGELNLPARRRQQIVAADDERHPLDVVVDGRGELVRPVALAILHQQIAALLRRSLFLRSVPEIDESLDGRLEADANADARPFGEAAIAARTGIATFGFIGGYGRHFRAAESTLKGCPCASHLRCGRDRCP